MRKMKRKMAAILVIFVAAMLGTATLLGFYMNADVSTGQIDALLQYSVDDSTWVDMEEYGPSITFSNVVPGDTDTLTRYVQMSSKANTGRTFTFTLTPMGLDDYEGITLTVANASGTIVQSVDGATDQGFSQFDPGQKDTYTITLVVDPYYDTEDSTIDLTWDLEVEHYTP